MPPEIVQLGAALVVLWLMLKDRREDRKVWESHLSDSVQTQADMLAILRRMDEEARYHHRGAR